MPPSLRGTAPWLWSNVGASGVSRYRTAGGLRCVGFGCDVLQRALSSSRQSVTPCIRDPNTSYCDLPPKRAHPLPRCRREPGVNQLGDELGGEAVREQYRLSRTAGRAGEQRERAATFAVEGRHASNSIAAPGRAGEAREALGGASFGRPGAGLGLGAAGAQPERAAAVGVALVVNRHRDPAPAVSDHGRGFYARNTRAPGGLGDWGGARHL
jgi:hypothetical protein